MNSVDAFLIVTAIAYYVGSIVPKRTVKNKMPLIVEKVLMAIMGTIIMAAQLFNFSVLYLGLGIASTAAACLTYLGYVKWNIAYKEEPSDAAQMVMFAWDLLIAVCCLSQSF